MLQRIANTIFGKIRKALHTLDKIAGYTNSGDKIKLVLISGIALFLGSLVLILNMKTPFVVDDFAYSMDVQNVSFAEALRVIYLDMLDYYFSWGGRVVAHIIAKLLLFASPLTADILNSIVYIIYAFLIYYHIKGTKKQNVWLFLLVNTLIWVIQPSMGDTMFWLTGSANYLWCTTIILLALLPYRMYENNAPKYSLLKAIAFFTMGILAGWTNENTITGAMFIALAFLISFKVNKWRIPAWAISGFVGLLIGYLIMVMAPGNAVRAAVIMEKYPLPLLDIALNFMAHSKQLIKVLGAFNLVGFILFLLIYYRQDDRMTLRKIAFLYSIYLGATLVSLYIMIFSPQFPPRAWFGLVTFNIISFGIVLNSLDTVSVQNRRIKQLILAYTVALFGIFYIEGYIDVKRIDNIWKEREKVIEQNRPTQTLCRFYNVAAQSKCGTYDTMFMSWPLSEYYKVPVEIIY